MSVEFSTADLQMGDQIKMVQIAIVRTSEDMVELREHHEDFHEGALRILRYPGRATTWGYLTHEPPPKAWAHDAVVVVPPCVIAKDEAGNFACYSLDDLNPVSP